MSFGVYAHVPYCRSVCPYCSFNVTKLKAGTPWPELAQALCAEADARLPVFAGPLQTLYFGGGTPSLAPPSFFAHIIAHLRPYFAAEGVQELTLELEPGTQDLQGLQQLRQLGFDRLSIGWQTQRPQALQQLGRGHDASAARQALADARLAGFANISLDLMFALPNQTMAQLQEDLHSLLQAQPEHISLYALTYEPKTPFDRQRLAGKLKPVGDAAEAQMLAHAAEVLVDAGYERYEVSSFARPGRRAVHNSSYWSGRPYLGLGPGAHSFARDSWHTGHRWEGMRVVPQYLRCWQGPSLSQQGLPREQDGSVSFVEVLDATALRLERMLLGLRQTGGVDLQEPALRSSAAQLQPGIDILLQRGWAELHGHWLRPTNEGLMHADSAAALFV